MPEPRPEVIAERQRCLAILEAHEAYFSSQHAYTRAWNLINTGAEDAEIIKQIYRPSPNTID